MLIDSNPCGRFYNLRKSLKIRVAVCKHPRLYGLSFPTFLPATPTASGCWLLAGWLLIMANGKVISHVAKIYGFHLLESHVEAAAASQTPQNVAAVRCCAAPLLMLQQHTERTPNSEEQTAIRTKIEFCSVARIPL